MAKTLPTRPGEPENNNREIVDIIMHAIALIIAIVGFIIFSIDYIKNI